jgi:hypothetical protein
MKDETRDQLERVRGGLSRTDYIEGAVLAQIARDLKKTEPKDFDTPDCHFLVDIIEDDRMPPNMAVAVPSGEVFVDGRKIEKPFFGGGIVGARISPQANIEREKRMDDLKRTSSNSFTVRSSAESKSGVLPVPKKAQKGRR